MWKKTTRFFLGKTPASALLPETSHEVAEPVRASLLGFKRLVELPRRIVQGRETKGKAPNLRGYVCRSKKIRTQNGTLTNGNMD